jgi:hypothetical protein
MSVDLVVGLSKGGKYHAVVRDGKILVLILRRSTRVKILVTGEGASLPRNA